MSYLGDFKASGSVNFNFTTHAASGASVAPLSAFEAADLVIYKAASATQRTSVSGVTMTSPFDSIVGLHHVTIDLSDNTDAGFWAAGNDYFVILSPDETVDSQTVVGQVASFSIENRVVNWAQVTSPTTTVGLSGTTIATTQKVDVETIKTQAVTCSAGVAVNANVGTTQPVNFTGTGASAYVKTDPTMLGASTQSLTDLKDFADTGYDPATHKVADVALLNGSATVTLANGGHGGSATELTLKKLNVTNSAGNAVEFVSTGGNGHGLYVIGDGAGDGVHWLGGTTGHGLNAQGGVTSGNGINATALGTGVPISGSITGNLTGSVNSVTTGVTISGTLTTLDAIWTKIKKWLQLGFRKDAAIATDNATELTEINADMGTGAGAFVSTTDSLQAIRDNQTASSAPTVQEITDGLLDELLSAHLVTGSVARGIASSAAAGDPLSSTVPGSYAADTAGFALGQVASFTSVEITGPVVGRVGTVGEVVDSQQINAYHYGPIEAGPFAVYEEDLVTPVDMSSYATALMFVVFEVVTSSSTGAKSERVIARLTTPDVTVGGASNNQVTILNTTPCTVEIGRFRWAIRRTTTGNKALRMQGWIVVDPCANTA